LINLLKNLNGLIVANFSKTDSFALRHLGPRENDFQNMLETIGVETLDQLIYETIPTDIRFEWNEQSIQTTFVY
jgi:glycine cleavage system pyridoxal-binding protein P